MHLWQSTRKFNSLAKMKNIFFSNCVTSGRQTWCWDHARGSQKKSFFFGTCVFFLIHKFLIKYRDSFKLHLKVERSKVLVIRHRIIRTKQLLLPIYFWAVYFVSCFLKQSVHEFSWSWFKSAHRRKSTNHIHTRDDCHRRSSITYKNESLFCLLSVARSVSKKYFDFFFNVYFVFFCWKLTYRP